jgi:hypothetical protein
LSVDKLEIPGDSSPGRERRRELIVLVQERDGW